MGFPTSDRGRKKVYLLITPLQPYYKYQLDQLDIVAAHSENHRVPFRRLQHWALQVGDEFDGIVYEVTSYWNTDGIREVRYHSAKDWRNGRSNPPRRKLFIAVTEWSSSALQNEAEVIWRKMFKQEYRGFSRNCQSFVEFFKAVIQDEELLTEEARTEIDDLPSSFNPLYVVLHLKQAKSLAIRLTRKARNKRGPCSGSETREGSDAQEQSRLPYRRSKRWLHHLNEASKQRDPEKDDFHKIVDMATQTHRTEKSSTKKLLGRFSIG